MTNMIFFKYQVPNYYLDLEREIKLLRNTKKYHI